jgi:hypothetical protein
MPRMINRTFHASALGALVESLRLVSFKGARLWRVQAQTRLRFVFICGGKDGRGILM